MEDNNKDQIKSYGYDVFMGREILKNGFEIFVDFDLKNKSSGSYTSLEFFYGLLCDSIKKGEKILLSKIPGGSAPETGSSSGLLRNLSSVLNKEIKNEIQTIVLENKNIGETYTIHGRNYLPFKKEQMDYLKAKFYTDDEMIKFPDPFVNQPK